MGVRVPKNKIKEGKYTSGGEYIVEATNASYTGYYYEFNNTLYAGKEYTPDSPKLIPVKNRNKLFGKGLSVATFSALTGITSQALQTPNFTPHFFNYDSDVRYFSYQTNANLIKEINKDTSDNIKSNPLYTVVSLSYRGGFNDVEVNEAEKKIPGIRTFINNSYTPPPTEDSGEIG